MTVKAVLGSYLSSNTVVYLRFYRTGSHILVVFVMDVVLLDML